MDATLQILRTLRTFRGLSLELPRRTQTLYRKFLFASVGIAAINLLFILLVTQLSITLTPFTELIADLFYLLFWIILLIAMAIASAPSVRAFCKALSPKNDFWLTFDETLLDYPHQRQQAQTLNTLYPRENFQAAAVFLKATISRNHARMGLILGTNTSLIVIFGLLYAYQQKTNFITLYLNGLFSSATGTTFTLGLLYLCAFSFLLGVALATLSCKILNSRYNYWLAIIDLALQLREDETRAAKEAAEKETAQKAAQTSAEKATAPLPITAAHKHPHPLTQRLRDAWRTLRHG